MHWPQPNQADLVAFYGTPGPAVERQMVDVVPPFQLFYGTKPIRAVKFHTKAAPALRAALQKIWDYYGHDQAVIDSLGIEHYDGAYNPRYIRGTENTTRVWSNHAYAAAIDLDAAHNGFGTGHGHMPLAVVAAFKSEGFRWGGDYQHRTDPMHFEACASGDPVRTFEQWLAFYKCPPSYNADNHPTVPLPRPAPKPVAVPPPPAPKPVEPEQAPEPEPTAVVPVDGSSDTQDKQIQDSADRDAEPRASWLRRKWKGATAWVSGGGVAGIAAYLTDPWAIVAIVGSLAVVALVIGGAVIWFMGPGDVRAWVRKQVT